MLQIVNLEEKSGRFVFFFFNEKNPKYFSFGAPRSQFEDISETVEINVPDLCV